MIKPTKNTNTDFSRIEPQIPEQFIPISKTVLDSDGATIPGIDVETHCRITGYVAEEILKLFPEYYKFSVIPEGAPFLAACHDIGKISPAFQKMIYSHLSDESMNSIFAEVNADFAKRKEKGFHAAITQAVFETVFKGDSHYKFIPKIEGMHHGSIPSQPYPEIKDSEWTSRRHLLLQNLKESFFQDHKDWPDLQSWDKACMVGGLVTVADWIASGGSFSELNQSSDLSETSLRKMAKEAVLNAGYKTIRFTEKLSFKDIFGFDMRTAQQTFVDSVTEPGVYVLEAPMGLGKTEAALYAGYKMIDAGFCNGIYFALPTQLTSNKIYDRVLSFLSSATGEPVQEVQLKLLHSSAWLEQNVLGEDAEVGKSWFDSAKRGILAPFAVGTIDQALMAVMNVKHGMVRTFGLSGKVVILDEVHSYDAYTGTIMNRLVACLRELGCTVIILSATLTTEQKKQIIGLPSNQNCQFLEEYPLITASNSHNPLLQFPVEKGVTKNVSVSFTNSMSSAVEIALSKSGQGEQVLWILNTVQDAQLLYQTICARQVNTIDVGLIHSRFTKQHRAENEKKWVSLFGKGNNERTKKGRILIGTQVLEQSLDIDADFLITQLCPTDMLLQRMGRLWRHSETDAKRPQSATCSMLIISPSYKNALNERNPFGLSAAVYSEYVLFRTLQQWELLTSIRLPDDIRDLLENTYQDRIENDEKLSRLKAGMESKRGDLQRMARVSESTAFNTSEESAESAAQTRYSEQDTCKVLLLKSLKKNGGQTSLTFIDGSSIEFSSDKLSNSLQSKRHIARKIMENTVSVSERNAPPYTNTVELFSPFVYTGSKDDNDHPFRYALVGVDSYLYSEDGLIIKGTKNQNFIYEQVIGYQINKEEN